MDSQLYERPSYYGRHDGSKPRQELHYSMIDDHIVESLEKGKVWFKKELGVMLKEFKINSMKYHRSLDKKLKELTTSVKFMKKELKRVESEISKSDSKPKKKLTATKKEKEDIEKAQIKKSLEKKGIIKKSNVV